MMDRIEKAEVSHLLGVCLLWGTAVFRGFILRCRLSNMGRKNIGYGVIDKMVTIIFWMKLDFAWR